ncbi:hypothetical protein LCGC14_2394410 [marine sediment metagenome]|uniref:Uncharacterized protein n=1 Tax=marine sediment metagenome TaxID=412755 RepID=A0A0F9BXA1_9ZZZZ
MNNSRLRLFGYKVVTQLLIWLDLLRDCIMPWGERFQYRTDRVFYVPNRAVFSCCDCGLAHLVWPLDGEEYREPAFKILPLRPFGYDYKGRRGAPSVGFPPCDEPEIIQEIIDAGFGKEP